MRCRGAAHARCVRELDRNGGGVMATEAYCVKCREKREMKDEKEVTFDNGRRAMQGTCPVCGTKMTRILPSKKK